MSGNNHHPSRNEYARTMQNARNASFHEINRAKAKAEAKARWDVLSSKEKHQLLGPVVILIGGLVLAFIIKAIL
jgi:hypothetical protein